MAGHVIARRTYLIVFAALLALLAATVAAGRFELGRFGPAVALGIAAAKALLIAVYFMHLRFSSTLSRLVAAGGLLWLAIMLSITLGDYGHRSSALDTGGPAQPDTPETPQSRAASRATAVVP